MDIQDMNNRLDAFVEMVMKDAAHKAGILLNQARSEKEKRMEEEELAFLKEAYHAIQQAIYKIDRENNERYSARLIEAKQLLFKKRQHVMEDVFHAVRSRLEQYRAGTEYAEKLKSLIRAGLNQVGKEDVYVLVDKQDMALARTIQEETDQHFTLKESDQPISGGCMVINEKSGLMADYSFSSRLTQQRSIFLELTGLSINIDVRS
jgi:vacuolar-type H+-ATPase subunit E/Vma4